MRCRSPIHVTRRLLVSVFVVALAWPALGGIDDLVMTEVDPILNVVEITNTGTETYVVPAGGHPFCHRFNYASTIAPATVFAPGQSIAFAVSGLHDTDSDIWLYKSGSFGSSANILTGMKYGPASNVGRTSVAVAAGLWPGTSAFVPAPAGGETLQLLATDPTLPATWGSASNTFESYFGTGVEILDPLPDIPKSATEIGLQLIAGGMVAPLGIRDPGDGRLFIYDQAGFVHLFQNGDVLPQPFMDVTNRLVSLGVFGPGSFDERGLLGFALHPDFATNGLVYTYTSEPLGAPADFPLVPPGGFTNDNQAVVAEWQVDGGNTNIVDPSTRRELIRVDDPQFNHNAGQLEFGPDGLLYIAIGDGGGADDQDGQPFIGGIPVYGHGTNGNGQTPQTVLGTLLRVDVDGTSAANGQYGIPAGNPFVGNTSGIPGEVFAYGLRNPYRFSFDQDLNTLYVADVGQNDIEEINIVTAGDNLGWRIKEGSFFFDPNGTGSGFPTTIPVVPVPGGLVDPIAEYDHDDGFSVIGGYVYRGCSLPALDGHFIFGEFGGFGAPTGRLLFLDDVQDIHEFTIGADDRALDYWVKGFGQDLDGEVYVCVSTNIGPFGTSGQVLKVVPLLRIDSVNVGAVQTDLAFVSDDSVTGHVVQANADLPDTNGWSGVPASLTPIAPNRFHAQFPTPGASNSSFRILGSP